MEREGMEEGDHGVHLDPARREGGEAEEERPAPAEDGDPVRQPPAEWSAGLELGIPVPGKQFVVLYRATAPPSAPAMSRRNKIAAGCSGSFPTPWRCSHVQTDTLRGRRDCFK